MDGISKSPAIFDIEKLRYFNASYIRNMSPEAFAEVAEPWIRRTVKNPAIDPAAVAALLQQRTEVLTEIPEKVDFFEALPDYEAALYVNKKSKCSEEKAREILTAILPRFEALERWEDGTLRAVMEALAAERGEFKQTGEVNASKVMWAVRIAAAGKAVTPGGAVEICRILGRDETLRRLRVGLEKLG